MREIPLLGSKANGRVALIDDEDFDLVSQCASWWIYERPHPGRLTVGPYARFTTSCGSKRVIFYMHKVITGFPMTDLRAGVRQAELVRLTGYTREQLRRIARDAGISAH